MMMMIDLPSIACPCGQIILLLQGDGFDDGY